MTEKYAVDVIAPLRIIDRHTDEVVVIDWIDPVPERDELVFEGYFEESGEPWERVLSWDSRLKVVESNG